MWLYFPAVTRTSFPYLPRTMRFSTLDEWLAWQETLHPRKIDLGLERVRSVFDAMQLRRLAPSIVTVAGTNGKGSSVAFLASILAAAGYRVGTYTSPHVYRYNERITVDGEAAGDDELCAAFARIDRLRKDTSLSYFEFGTLAAFQIFADRELDAVILEVGLGGRLDAVNAVDADCALITRIGIDHVEWLGTDREQIGAEKAAIFRPGKPAVCSDILLPDAIGAGADALGARLFVRGKEFDVALSEQHWDWMGPGSAWPGLPYPSLAGGFQIDNAAGVLMVLACLQPSLPVSLSAIREGLRRAWMPGRLQLLPGNILRVLDVAHNPQAAEVLAAFLAAHPVSGSTLAVIGMLADKDVEGVIDALDGQVDRWYPGSIDGEARGLDAAVLAERAGIEAPLFDSLMGAYRQAMRDARTGDRVVVTGSFVGVAQVLAEL